jgi:hypothetical protein
MSKDRLPADDEQVEKPKAKPTARKKTTKKAPVKKELTREEKEAVELLEIAKNVLEAKKVLAENMTKLRKHKIVPSSKISALDKAVKLLMYNFE